MNKYILLILMILFTAFVTLAQVTISGNITVKGSVSVGSSFAGFGAFSTTTKTCAGQGNGTPANSVACTPSTSFASGELMVCGVAGNTTGNTYTITDSNGDTFNMQGSIVNLGGGASFMQNGWFRATTTITSVTAHLTLNSTFAQVKCQSATGGAVSPADGQTTANANPGLGSTTLTALPAISASSSTDYVVCPSAFGGGTTLTVGTGFTLGSSNGSNNITEYQVASTSTITPTINIGSAGNGGMVCSAFHP